MLREGQQTFAFDRVKRAIDQSTTAANPRISTIAVEDDAAGAVQRHRSTCQR